MRIVNAYSLAHLLIWFIAGRYTPLKWVAFLTLSLLWEGLELVLPFDFAVESMGNKLADIVVNILGYAWGVRSRPSNPRSN